MTDQRLIHTKTFEEPLQVLHIVMGHDRDDIAILRVTDAPQQVDSETDAEVHHRVALRVIDTRALVPANFGLTNSALPHGDSTAYYLHFRATGDLRFVTSWRTNIVPAGVILLTVSGRMVSNGVYQHQDEGHLSVAPDGTIYTARGNVVYFEDPEKRTDSDYNRPLLTRHRIPQQSLVAPLDGLLYIGISKEGAISLYRAGSTLAIASLGSFPDWESRRQQSRRSSVAAERPAPPGASEARIDRPLTLDRRVVFAPSRGYIAFVPYSDRRIVQRRFDLKETLEGTGGDYLLTLGAPPTKAVSGEKWGFQLSVMAKYPPLKYVLETAPEGMTISADGELAWRPPSNLTGRTEVVVKIHDAKNNAITEKFFIGFKPGRPRSPEERGF